MKKIALLGSAKHHTYVKNLADALEKQGFYIFLFPNASELRKMQFPETVLKLVDKGLTYDGFEKIKRSDYALFVNVGGYMGNSATLELGYCAGLSKHIIALNHDVELTRDALFNDVVGSEDIQTIVDYMVKHFK